MALGSVGKRKAERRDCHVKAQVLVSGCDPIDCVILNFSATGARARLHAEVELPARFKLFIPSRPETKLSLLRWRRGLEFGCEYSSGLADEESLFVLLDRVDRLEAALGSGAPAAPVQSDVSPALAERLAELEARLVAPSAQSDDAVIEDLQARVDMLAALETRVSEIDDRLNESRGHGGSTNTTEMDDLRARVDMLTALETRIDNLAADSRAWADRFASRLDATQISADLVPNLVERVARLEMAPQPRPLADHARAPEGAERLGDSNVSLMRRVVDIEARLAALPASPPRALDLTRLERRIDLVAEEAESHVVRAERFLKARMDEFEKKQIFAPPPPPARGPTLESLELKVIELAQRIDDVLAPEARGENPDSLEFEAMKLERRLDDALTPVVQALQTRMSNIEVSLLDLRSGTAQQDEGHDLENRIARIEERNDEVLAALQNVLAMLQTREAQRAAG
jgi:hypothetical protein